MKNKIILFLVCLILVIFIIDITKETFQSGFSSNVIRNNLGSNSGSNENPKINSNEINSIVSKVDGAVLNISFIEKGEIDSPAKIRIHTNNSGNYLGINNDSNGLIEDNSNNYKWELHKIVNNDKIHSISGGRGKNAVCINPPFYMITGNGDHSNLALQYNYGRLMTAKIGNYDKQAWDVSDKKLDTHQLVVKNIYQTPVGPLTPGESIVDPNKIKINLSVLDDSLKKMLGLENVDSSNSNSNSNSQQCDRYLSKEVVSSLCPGCVGI